MKNCLVLLLFFCCFTGYTQKAAPGSLRAKYFELKAKSVPEESLKLPFESIKIIDSRFDTSSLGFRVDKLSSFLSPMAFNRIILKPGIGAGIENFYNQYFQPAFTPNGKVLLISIKTLWIDDMPARTYSQSRQNLEKLSRQDIYAKLELYVGAEDAYTPLLRVDTIFQLTSLNKVDDYDESKEARLPFFCFALEKMIENVNFDYYLNERNQRKEMSLADIENFNAKKKNIPILRDPIKTGVFLTLEEFKNNLPSIHSFSRRNLKKTGVSEVLDKKGNLIRNYFACYDGTTLRIGKPLSALIRGIPKHHDVLYRVGDSFQYYEYHPANYTTNGRTSEFNSSAGKIPSIDYRYYSKSIIFIPRQLDLDSGNN